jgi:hypothetical protein
MDNLALVLQDQKQYDVAEQMHQEALESYKEVLGQAHPDTILCKNNLQSCLETMGERTL